MCISAGQHDSQSGIHSFQDSQSETKEVNFSPAARIRAISGKPVEAAALSEYWHGLSEAVIEQLADAWHKTSLLYQHGRMQHYFSSEFLMGRSLENNLVNHNLVNTLRLWRAESPTPFNYELFNEQKFDEAVDEREKAANISRVLYPNDSTHAGKLLRLSQQYFFVSASLQCIADKYAASHGNDFSD